MAAHIPGPLYYEQAGATGTPMIFLHSTPDDHRFWMYQTAHFSSWYRTLAVDLAGYGRSPAVQPGVTMADHAEACWEVVDRISSGGAIIHGNSMGGIVALWMAHLRPERTLALILSGVGHSASNTTFLNWVRRYTDEGIALRHEQLLDHLAPASRLNPVLLHYVRMVEELNNEGTLASIIANNQALSHRLTDEQIAGISAPAINIYGTLDRGIENKFTLQKLLKNSEVVGIEGAAHACNLEAPAAYDAHAIRFLDKLGLHQGPAA